MEQPVNWLEIVSIVSSIVSVIIGGFAIWLAVKFYEMSNQSAQKLEAASKSIEATNKKLEMLFEKLYTDTFSIVKETVTDMRRHVWKHETSQSPSDEKIAALKKELISEFETTLATKNDMDEVHDKVNELISSAVEKATNVSKESDKQEVLEVVRELGEFGRKVTIRDISSYMDVDKGKLVPILFSLRQDGLITWNDSEGRLTGVSNISVLSKANS